MYNSFLKRIKEGNQLENRLTIDVETWCQHIGGDTFCMETYVLHFFLVSFVIILISQTWRITYLQKTNQVDHLRLVRSCRGLRGKIVWNIQNLLKYDLLMLLFSTFSCDKKITHVRYSWSLINWEQFIIIFVEIFSYFALLFSFSFCLSFKRAYYFSNQ